MWIGRPVAPGYVHSATRGHRYVDFVVAGLEPTQEFTMHFYAPHDEDLLAELRVERSGEGWARRE